LSIICKNCTELNGNLQEFAKSERFLSKNERFFTLIFGEIWVKKNRKGTKEQRHRGTKNQRCEGRGEKGERI